jgi:nitroreductase
MESDYKKILEFIKTRRSVRNFVEGKISRNTILDVLECARWAPSGRNNQPWRIHVVTHLTVKSLLAELTEDSSIIKSAFLSLVIFLDLERSYDRVKDLQAIGAFMQNILLAVHATSKLGAVWLGEILNKKEKVNNIFKLSTTKYELMGVIAVGEKDESVEKAIGEKRERRPLEEFVDWFQ